MPFGLALAAGSAAFLAVYLLTRAQVHGWDSLAYAARAAGDPLLSEKFLSTRYFHPHHLLYVPFAQGCRAALGWLPGADLFAPLQWANSLLGAGCVLLAGLIVRALGGGPGRALFAAAAVGFANGVWTYATAVEVMIPALFCLLLSVWLLARARSAAGHAAAGAAMAAAILLHQIAAVAAAAAGVALLLAGVRPRGRALAAFALACALPVVAVYVGAGIADGRALSVGGFLDWVLAARSRSAFGTEPAAVALRHAAGGLARSVVVVDIGGAAAARAAAVGAAAAFGALLLVAGGGALRRGRGGPAVPALALAAAGIAAFILWFEPWTVDYWVYVVALGWVLVAARAPAPAGWGRLVPVSATCYLLLIAILNLTYRALPARDPDRAEYRAAVDLARTRLQPPGSLLILASGGGLNSSALAIPLFAGVAVDVAPVDTGQAAAERYRGEVAAELAAGRRVFATGRGLALVDPRRDRLAAGEARGVLDGDSVFALHAAADSAR